MLLKEMFRLVQGGGKPACFHNGSNREGKVVAAAGSGAHAGFADSRAIPVWLSGSLSIHADDSILLQKDTCTGF